MDWSVERAPQLKAAWAERANVCQALHDSEEEIFSRCQALTLSQDTSDDTLRRRWGLMRLYGFEGKPCWPLAYADGQVYVGTLEGGLWSVRTDSLDLGLVGGWIMKSLRWRPNRNCRPYWEIPSTQGVPFLKPPRQLTTESRKNGTRRAACNESAKPFSIMDANSGRCRAGCVY